MPYTDADIAGAGEAVKGKTELDALIAYLPSSAYSKRRKASFRRGRLWTWFLPMTSNPVLITRTQGEAIMSTLFSIL